MASELPGIAADQYEPLYVQEQVLVVRTRSAALQHALREREAEVVDYVTQAAGITVRQLRFRP
jgi:hypothetical protein